MFIAAAGGGIIVVGVLAHDNHSNYSDHSNHSRYTEYGDSYLVNQINDMQNRINRQETDISDYAQHISREYRSRMADLRNEADYNALNADEDSVLHKLKEEMEQEIKDSIKEEQAQLQNINAMIKKINELEMQATK